MITTQRVSLSAYLIKEVRMNDQSSTLKGKAINLEKFVDYAGRYCPFSSCRFSSCKIAVKNVVGHDT
jgi:hypothetical protein